MSGVLLRGIETDRYPVEHVLRKMGYTRVVAAREGWVEAECDCGQPDCAAPEAIEHLFTARDERGVVVSGLLLVHPDAEGGPQALELWQ